MGERDDLFCCPWRDLRSSDDRERKCIPSRGASSLEDGLGEEGHQTIAPSLWGSFQLDSVCDAAAPDDQIGMEAVPDGLAFHLPTGVLEDFGQQGLGAFLAL